MNTMGHAEAIERSRLFSRPTYRLGWRPDYRKREGYGMINDTAYGQYADLGVKASAAAMSTMLLLRAQTPTEKIVFALSTVILGAVTAASAFETF